MACPVNKLFHLQINLKKHPIRVMLFDVFPSNAVKPACLLAQKSYSGRSNPSHGRYADVIFVVKKIMSHHKNGFKSNFYGPGLTRIFITKGLALSSSSFIITGCPTCVKGRRSDTQWDTLYTARALNPLRLETYSHTLAFLIDIYSEDQQRVSVISLK